MGKVWVSCCDGVSAIVFAVSYAVALAFLAIVGSTLGAFAGVLIGVNSKKNLFYSVAVGAVAGGKFLVKAFRMSISFWLSDDDLFSNVLQSLSRLEQAPMHADNMVGEIAVDRANVSKNSSNTIRKIRITEDLLMDCSGNRNSCSICLQDFECRDAVRRLPHCRHLFHLCCIDKWISKQRSCPLCRSPIVQVN